MRLSHPSLLGIITLIAASLLSGANSAPIAHGSVSLRHDSVSLTKVALAGRDMNSVIFESKLTKRDTHKPTKKKKSTNSKGKNNRKSKSKSKSPKKISSSKARDHYEYSGDGTYYNTGLGSCGITSKDTDLIAALNAPQMSNGANPNNNPICGKKAKVKGPNGTVTVTIVDTCPPCKSGDLDLSPAAFGKIADFVDGRVNIEWSWA
ncbi:hypothetical protein K501DRAFT_268656 [Backusella circina FSU 941]|nr:hypothetical protein K501DRAFT_268656 [Backusella circina FSU 941]